MDHAKFFENRLVRGLSRKQAELLFAAGTVSTLPPETVVLDEGDAVDRLSVILSGEVQVYLPDAGHRPAAVNLSVLGAHDCFGEYAFVDERPASASIRTRTETVLYQIGNVTLQSMLGTHTDIGCIVYRNLLRILVERLRASNAELDLFTLPDFQTA